VESSSGSGNERPRLSETDARLLDLIQADFPAVPRPYAELAARLAAAGPSGRTDPTRVTGAATPRAEAEVMKAVGRFRASGLIRRLGGVFDSRALGLTTTLVAARVPPDRLDDVAAMVSLYPEVTHNYAREGPYNLWFTLVAGSPERVAVILDDLRKATGIGFCDLPADRIYKREVRFRLYDGGTTPEATTTAAETAAGNPGRDLPATGRADLDETDTALIAALQGDLPDGPRPYARLGEALGRSEGEVLARIAAFRERGWLRRLSAILAHRRAGIQANAMVVWQVPEELLDQAGRSLARSGAVTHCYARPPLDGWPYRLYTMIHGRTREEVTDLVRGLSLATGLPSYQVLFSTREYKKTSPQYF